MVFNSLKFLCCIVWLSIFNQSCYKQSLTSQIAEFKEYRFSSHWSIKLPGEPLESTIKDQYFSTVYKFEADSMTLKVQLDTIDTEEAMENFKFSAKAEKEKTPVVFCMGDSGGEFEFHNYLDHMRKLSGVILDYEENGKKSVWFTVQHAETGERLVLFFEFISASRMKLIHEMIRNIVYTPGL